MSNFLLCVILGIFLCVLIIVCRKIMAQCKRRKPENDYTEDIKPVQYTFSSVFPNKEIMDKTFEIMNQNREKEKNKIQ